MKRTWNTLPKKSKILASAKGANWYPAYLSVPIGHLLKWQAQPEQRSKSWSATIAIQRKDLVDLLEEMPSLQAYLAENLNKAHQRAVILASWETLLPMQDFPSTCPYPLDALLDPSFLP